MLLALDMNSADIHSVELYLSAVLQTKTIFYQALRALFKAKIKQTCDANFKFNYPTVEKHELNFKFMVTQFNSEFKSVTGRQV